MENTQPSSPVPVQDAVVAAGNLLNDSSKIEKPIELNTAGKPVMRDAKGRLLPGNTPNPLGKPKGSKHLTTRLLEAIERIEEGETEPTDVVIIKRISQLARRGDLAAINMIWGRLEGSVPQNVNLAADGIAGLDAAQLARLNALLLGASDSSAKDAIKTDEQTAAPLPEQPKVEEQPKEQNGNQ